MLRDAIRAPARTISLRWAVVAAVVFGLALLATAGGGRTSATNHCTLPSYANNARVQADCATLLGLENTLDERGELNWRAGLNMESWDGILFDGSGVTHLLLTHKELIGQIPAELADLPSLKVLNLGGNAFYGTIPEELGARVDPNDPTSDPKLKNLKELELWGSNFASAHPDYSIYNIPDQYGFLETVVHPTTVYGNTPLGGDIPASLGNLTNLELLRLDSNLFSGHIPAELTNLAKLERLNLQNNRLDGSIPSAIGNLTALEALVLSQNSLGNDIPTSIQNLASLMHLSLDGNELTGPIPNLARMTSLEGLYLSNNNLTGSIPTALARLGLLASINLSENRLTGTIPSGLGDLSDLKTLDLSRNELTGSIPSSLGRLSSLRSLFLDQNQLTGSIPAALGDLRKLLQLRLDNNQLGGPIPSGLFDLGDDPNSTDDDDLGSLTDLSLYRNQLGSAIPPAIGNLANLEHLNLSENSLTGTIPIELGKLSKVDWMGLSCNYLNGRIPSALGDIPVLRVLFLNGNQLDVFVAGSTTDIDEDKVPDSLDDVAVVWLTNDFPCLPSEFDKTPPKFKNAHAVTTTTDGVSETKIIMTYDEVLDRTYLPNTSALTVTVDGQERGVSSVTADNEMLELILASPVEVQQVVKVAYTYDGAGDEASRESTTNPAIQDPAGNDAADLATTTVRNDGGAPDNRAPVFQTAETASSGTKIILTYDEVLNSSKPPRTGSFSVAVDSGTAAVKEIAVSSLSVNDRSVELRLAEAIEEGRDVTVAYRDPTGADDEYAIQDRSGNDAVSVAETVSNENDPPYDGGEGKVDEDAPSVTGAEMGQNGTRILVTFNEILDSNGPSNSDFAISVDADTTEVADTRTVTLVTVNDATIELDVNSAISEGREVVLTYTDPDIAADNNDVNVIEDRLGNDTASFTTPVENDVGGGGADDVTPPEFQTAVTADQGRQIVLTYDEVLNSDDPPPTGAFTVTVDGGTAFEETRSVSRLTVTGTTVQLVLNSAVREGRRITLTYTDPSSADDEHAIQDRPGNDATDLVTTVANENSDGDGGEGADDTRAPLFKDAVVGSEGLRIVLIYDEILENFYIPEHTAFAVTVDEEVVDLRGSTPITVDDENLTLHLANVIRKLQDVTVAYTAPTNNDARDNAAIQDRVGNDADSLTLTKDQVDNNSRIVETDPPTLESAVIRAPEEVNGQTVTYDDEILLTFSELLDEINFPEPANFQYTVQGETRDIDSFTVSGKTVTLHLPSAITEGQDVTVTYFDPTERVNDDNAIQDRLGNDAATVTSSVDNQSATLDETAPVFQYAVLSSNGSTIVMVYNEVLDSLNKAPTSAFTVEADGSAVTLTGVYVTGRNVEVDLQSAVTEDQTVTVAYTDPSDQDDENAIQDDPAGNDAASLTAQTVHGESTAPDGDPPGFVSAVIPVAGETIVLTFDEDLDGTKGPRTSDFSHTVHGESRDVSDITVSGQTVTLTLPTIVTSDEVVSVTYTDPRADFDDPNAIQDLDGNDAASLSRKVTNGSTVEDGAGPDFVNAATSDDGKRIILTFSEVLFSDNGPLDSDFDVKVDGVSVVLALTTPVLVRGRTVELALDEPVTADQTVTVTYNAPTAVSDTSNPAIQDPAGNDAARFEDKAVTNNAAQAPSRPSTPSGSTPSGSTPGSSTPGTTPGTPQGPLVLTITVSGAPIEVGQTLNYTVTIVNTGTEPLTGVTWRDVTSGAAAQSLNDIAVSGSISTTGSFGTVQAGHMPGVILTVAADSDQTSEREASLYVEVVAATPQPPGSDELSGQPPGSGTRPRVPSSLVLRVVRVQFNVPDVHLAHNIPDLLLTLPDGSETTCNFLTHYENTGGLTRWGHTTSEVLEERPGSLTQYYQRGVVDCHEREGDWLMERRLTWDHFGGGIDGSEDLGVEPHLLSEQPGELLGPWGHKVSNYAVDGTYIGFLDFFTALGGVPAFGYPKSEARYDNDPRRQLGIAVSTKGFVRQYFQAAVMEYHPDTLSTVMLRLLGDDLRNRRYPNESYKTFSSFGSVPPLRVGQIYVAELVSASPGAAPTLRPPVLVTPLPATPAKPSTLKLRVDRVLYREPDVHMGHNIPDLTLLLPDGSESTCNFLAYYESNHGVARWGHATSEVLEERDGVLTQYFQRGVLDCEERDGAWGVSRRLAWDYVGGGAAGAPDLGVEPALVSEQAGDLVGPWGHRVSNYAVDGTFIGFLDFFSALGGVETFGYPKTEARYDDDPRAELSVLGAARRVIRQYFQSAVLEYHPADTAQPVKLRLLGDDVRDRLYPNQTYRAYDSFGPSIPLAKGQFYSPERITPPGTAGAPVRTPPPPPSATSPSVIPSAPSTLGLRVNRVLFSAPDVHLAHNIPDLTLTLADGSEASCDFLTYFESNFGLARWGHPISEVLEERPGSLTQYFQRGVLDCHERDGEWRVERRLAWDHIGGGVDGAPDLGVEPDLLSDQAGELLGPWGHRVSNYAVDGTYVGFLDFFTSLGGEATFGLPKTEARYDDDPRAELRVPGGAAGVIRQYFQAAVLEYHPNDAAQPVKLYLLGDTLRDWRYPTYGVFITFGSFGPLTEGQPYYPVATSSVLRPAG